VDCTLQRTARLGREESGEGPEYGARMFLIASVVLAGLFAGLFATFSYAVMPGLRRADDASFVQAMRQINLAILNPVFAVVFVGAPLVAAAAAIVGFDESSSRWWVVAGAALLVATIATTMGINVPMNDRLEAGVKASEGATELRNAFERPWVAWNHVRTVLSTGALVALAVAVSRAA
jgi:uncharacterized membrane protein